MVSGSTQREHLQAHVPNHEWLKPFEMTPYEAYISSVFEKIFSDRQYDSMTGLPRRLTLQTFVYYQQLFDDVLNTDEIELLRRLDAVYVSTVAELRKDE